MLEIPRFVWYELEDDMLGCFVFNLLKDFLLHFLETIISPYW